MPVGGFLGDLIVGIGVNADKLSKGLGQAQRNVEAFSTRTSKNIVKFESGFRQAGFAVSAASGLMAAGLNQAIQPAIGFEKQMAFVNTMIENADGTLQRFRGDILGMSKNFGESTQTLSRGLYDILSASIPTGKAMGVLDASAKAAAAGMTDTGTAADAVTTLLNSYQLQAEDASSVSDLLFAIVKRGKTTFAELAPAIGTAAATVAQGKLSMEEFAATLATATRQGVPTRMAVFGVKSAVQAFIKPTKEAKIVASEYGIELNTTWLKANGLRTAVKKLSEIQPELRSKIIPNTRAMLSLNTALADSEGFTKDLGIMQNRTGLTMEAYAKTTATTEFQLNKLKQTMEVLFINVMTPFLPVLNSVAEALSKVAGVASDAAEAIPGFSKAIVTLTSAFTALGLVVGPLLIVLPSLARGFLLVKKAALSAIPGVAAFGAALKSAFPVLLITAAVAGIIAATAGLYKGFVDAKDAAADLNLEIEKNRKTWAEVTKSIERKREIQTARINALMESLKKLRGLEILQIAEKRVFEKEIAKLTAERAVTQAALMKARKFAAEDEKKLEKEALDLKRKTWTEVEEKNLQSLATRVKDVEYASEAEMEAFLALIDKKRKLDKDLTKEQVESLEALVEASKTAFDKMWDGFVSGAKTAKEVAEDFGKDLFNIFSDSIAGITSELVSLFTGWKTQREEQLESLKETMQEEADSWSEMIVNINKQREEANQAYLDGAREALDEYLDYKILRELDAAQLEEELNKRITMLESKNISDLTEEELRAHDKGLAKLKQVRDTRIKDLNDIEIKEDELRVEHNKRMDEMVDKQNELSGVTGTLISAFDSLKNAIIRAATELIAMKIVKGIIGGPAGLILHAGGMVPGNIGEPVVATLQAGERVMSRNEVLSAGTETHSEGRTIKVTNNFYGDIHENVDVEQFGKEIGESINTKLKR